MHGLRACDAETKRIAMLVAQLCAFDLQLRPAAALARRSRRSVLSSSAPPPNDDPEKRRSALETLADASWDLFVMPGEHANSRYDRFGREPSSEPRASANTTAAAAFDWGRGGVEDEALRLPTGVAAAERLAASGQPTAADRERRRQDQLQSQLLPLAVLAIPLAAGVIEVGVAGVRALSVPPATEQHAAAVGRPASERRLTEDEWIARRIESRRTAAAEGMN